MSLTPGDTEPSQPRAGATAGAAPALSNQVRFDRRELDRILNVYGRKVAEGEWRDYAIDFMKDRAMFSVFRRASEVPLYRIEKDPKLARRQGAYSVIFGDRPDHAPRSRAGSRAARVRQETQSRRPWLTGFQGGVSAPGSQRALHQHGVEPPSMPETDIGQCTGRRKTKTAVQLDRCRLLGVADHRDHLTKPALLRFRNQGREQQPADAAAMDARSSHTRCPPRYGDRPTRGRYGPA